MIALAGWARSLYWLDGRKGVTPRIEPGAVRLPYVWRRRGVPVERVKELT